MIDNFKCGLENNMESFISIIEFNEKKLGKPVYNFSLKELETMCKNNGDNFIKFLKQYINWCEDNSYVNVNLSELL